MRGITFFWIIFFLCGNILIFCCTGITGLSARGILVGNNEDYIDSFIDTVVRVRPAAGGIYGCLLVGFYRQDFSMGGMNDQGLYFDMFTVPDFVWASDPNRLDYEGFLEGKMLSECATVVEAIDFLLAYNNPGMGTSYYQIFLVDRTGDAAIINWWNGDYEVVRKENMYMAVTNFLLLHPEYGGYPCWRFITASEMLKNAGNYTVEFFRSILKTVSLTSNYSNICNLNTGDLIVYNRYNFQEFIQFNIHQELTKGYLDYQLPDYFSQIHIQTPQQGETVNQLPLTFNWEGDPNSSYQLFLSTDPEFTDCIPIELRAGKSLATGSPTMYIPFLFFVGFLSIHFLGKKKNNWILFLLLIILFSFFQLACESPSALESNSVNVVSITVDDLQSNTTYYWKIRAIRSEPVFTESIVFTFNTGDVE
jgi:hypothetical protein